MIDAYIVGAQKAGTSALYNWLGQHEDIFAPSKFKDFPLFSGSEENYSAALMRADKVYCSKTAKRHALRIGADANLISHPKAVKRLKDNNNQTRVIFLIREPSERCFSAWRYARERNIEVRSFSEAIEQELRGEFLPLDSYKGRQMNYLLHSRYLDQLKVIGECFPPEQILLLPFDRLREAPAALMDECTDFLGVQRKAGWQFDVVNQTVTGSRSKFLSEILYTEKNTTVFKLARKLAPWGVRAWIRRRLLVWNRTASIGPITQRIDAITANKIRQSLSKESLLHSQLLKSTLNTTAG